MTGKFWSKFRSKFFFLLKFVLAIVDEIFNKKNGGQFFSRKKDQTRGGGAEGGLVKDHTFAAFFFVHPSLIIKVSNVFTKVDASTLAMKSSYLPLLF